MHPEFEKLPHFRILEVQHRNPPEYGGVFDGALNLGKRSAGYLMSADDSIVSGRFSGFDALNSTAVFYPDASANDTPLAVGKLYAYLEGYWGERVALVLDRSEKWARTRFAPRDTDVYKLADQVISAPSGQAPPSPEWVYQHTISAHWDHEHCQICWRAISEDDQPYGYRSDTGKWICEKCYVNYVQPRRIAFIDDLAISQIRGECQPKPGSGPSLPSLPPQV